MNELFISLKKKVITESDRTLACDYVDYYGINPTEYKEYADSFVEECYVFNEETGEHEETRLDNLPFAKRENLGNGYWKWSYRGCSVIHK